MTLIMNKMGMKAAALIIGLPLFLLACEKDLAEQGSGKKVTINFTVANEGYGADQQIMKSADAKEAKPETVYIPLDNNYFIVVTLMPEPEEEIRATAAFVIGQKIRFAAYNGASEVGSAIYTWDGSKFIPDDEPLGVEPDNDVIYHFVAYSFFGDPMTEPDDEDVEEEILPAQDLVWGEQNQKIYNNETSRTVPILMQHKFSRVQVMVDASTIDDAKVTSVSGVVIAGGKKADLTVWTGGLAASSAVGADVTATMEAWASENNGKARLSGYKVFYPTLTTITFATIDLEIDGDPLPLTDKSVTFAQVLDENTSYRVVVDVRANRWAWSNIYWDDALNDGAGALTFDKTLVDLSHQYYQGVLFKWGSLVGVSPVGSKTDARIYIPDDISLKTWDGTKTLSSSTWGNFESIPRTDTGSSPTYDENYLYGHYDYGSYRGDICSYLTDGVWHMV
jgi:hypothetical protein